MAEITATAREARVDAIEGLRHLADVFEANPQLPVLDYVSWRMASWERTEAERFNLLHDLADVLGGVTVTEKPESGERELRVQYGELKLFGTAEADRREPPKSSKPRPVGRPLPSDGEQPS